MTAQRIREIVSQIGPQSPYWRMVPGGNAGPLPLAQRCWIALSDHAFGWGTGMSFNLGEDIFDTTAPIRNTHRIDRAVGITRRPREDPLVANPRQIHALTQPIAAIPEQGFEEHDHFHV